ncbi:MAG: hypothetical protein A2Y65_12585 [Deltaproteobacteria bacterium RBG_13_52_11]|nr:MAG: hypothetical protein A2Y65_12585 [Deltaproteobacteria bacterium RBG_13_52_11]
MKLSVKGLTWAAAFGSLLAFAVVGVLNIFFPGYGGDYLNLMMTFYPGYNATWAIKDVIIGAVYVFVDGLICGLIFALLYNLFTGKGKKAAPRRAAARRAAPKKRTAAKKRPAAKKKKAAGKKRKR